MAAFDTPWLTHMSAPKSQRSDPLDSNSSLLLPTSPSRKPSALSSNDGTSPAAGANPTYASFSPTTLSSTTPMATSAAKRRSTILVHQKSPLLLATPPQITRALAYSHPFLLPLNKLAGLLSWSTGDPWESFLMVVVFWATVLYGDFVIRLAGPIVLVLILIAGMYGRRFSPLSSSGWSEPGLGNGDGSANPGAQKPAKLRKAAGRKTNSLDSSGVGLSNGKSEMSNLGHQRSHSAVSEITNTRHQKTLDEIVDTLKEFTSRCNILLEPALELTDFLSTQRTPTSATTRPALTTLFVRILLCTPFWIALTLPPLRIVTTRRVILVFGTVVLTWHSRVMQVGRTILWRSATVRRLSALVTGLEFEGPMTPSAAAGPSAGASTAVNIGPAGGKPAATAAGTNTPRESELTKALRRARAGQDAGVRFTFILYENQRRWVGLGWTTSLFAYERSAWTDEHNNAVPPRDKFELPEVENGSRMRWRWVLDSRWRVDGVSDEAVSGANGKDKSEWDYDGPGGRMGWVYYDNKWQNGRRGQDGWGRWTRRRKWYRDAELVEVDDNGNGEERVDIHTPNTISEQYAPTPQPTLQPRPIHVHSPSSSHAPLETQSAPNLLDTASAAGQDKDREKDDDYDSASLLSSSSRSTRFKSSSLRRRVTDSSRGTNSPVSTTATGRSRRASEVASEDDTLTLGTQVELEIHGAGKEGGSWGVGDEVRMGLE